jgi:hypothetical protein
VELGGYFLIGKLELIFGKYWLQGIPCSVDATGMFQVTAWKENPVLVAASTISTPGYSRRNLHSLHN